MADSDASGVAGDRCRAVSAPHPSAFAASGPSVPDAAKPAASASPVGHAATLSPASAGSAPPSSVALEKPLSPASLPHVNIVEQRCGIPREDEEENPEIRHEASAEPAACGQHISEVAGDRHSGDEFQLSHGENSGAAFGNGGMFAGLDMA